MTNTASTSPTSIIIDLPRRFYDDHVDRDLPHGAVVKWMRHTVRVAIMPAALLDVLDDARHYVAMGTAAFGPESAGLVASARATVRRIEADEVAWQAVTEAMLRRVHAQMVPRMVGVER